MLGVTIALIGVSVVWVGVEFSRQRQLNSKFSPSRWVNLKVPPSESDLPAATGPAKEDSLRVAVAPVISPEKSLQMYRGLVDHLAMQVGRSPQFLQRDSYAAVNDLVRSARCDVAFVCTYAFVRGEREFGMEALAIPEVNGATSYHSYLIVPADSNASSLLDLRDTRFASADMLSNSGWLYPAKWLHDRGIAADSFFKEHVIAGSHDRSVLAVASRYVDGAAVDSLVYDYMIQEETEIAEKTRIILKSPPFGMPPIVVPRQIEPELKQQVRDALLGMHKDAEGRKILASLGIGRFVAPEAGLFDSVREAAVIMETGQ